MYIPRCHQLDDRAGQLALMTQHPLATWVCHTSHGLVANHLPLWLDRSRGPLGTLLGHVSRANGVWTALAAGAPSVLVFQGPQAYISPGWYPGHARHGRVVPTWNYAVVHAHGTARAFDDRDRLLDLLHHLSDAAEQPQPRPWRVGDAPAGFIDEMRRAVVGIEVVIERLEGKLKASQDEALEDRHGTVRGLRERGTDEARTMADQVEQAIARDTGAT